MYEKRYWRQGGHTRADNYTCPVRAQTLRSCLTVIPQTVARQVPLSMGFSRQEYWSGLPFSTLGDLQTQGSNLSLVRLQHCKWILYH